jgi:hypothetical protein
LDKVKVYTVFEKELTVQTLQSSNE